MTVTLRAFLLVLGFAFGLAGAAPAFAAPTFPPLTGRVVDDAHVLSPQTQADLTAKLTALEQKTGDQLVVVTLPSLQGYEIEDYGYQLGRAWGIGEKGKNTGALLIVAPAEHKVRIEVGYGLEPVLTDALTSVILQTTVLPKFRTGDVEGGVVDGTNAIIAQLGLDPAAAQAKAQAAAQAPPAAPPIHIPLFLIIVIVFIVIRLLFRGGGLWGLPFLFMGGGGFRRRRRFLRRRRWRRVQRRWRLVRRRRLVGELVTMLSQTDSDRIHQAIATAEAATEGEIFCVAAKASGKYREVPLAWAAGAALLAPPLALASGLRPAGLVEALLLVVQSGWSIAEPGAQSAMVTSALVGYAALQAALFVLVLGLTMIPAVRAWLTPAGLKRERVHARAMEQFTHRLHATKAVTGILIYVSIAERRVEVIADEAIDKKVAPGEWDRAVAAAVGPIGAGDVADGLIAAIEICGAALAEHFPSAGAHVHQDDGDHLAEV